MNNILEVLNLSVQFKSKKDTFTAVKDISFEIEKGKTLALVGESGSGKSVTALSILQLLPYPVASHGKDSSIKLNEVELLGAKKSLLTSIRGSSVSMIFQEPMTALNPVMTIGGQIDEIFRYHVSMSAAERRKRAIQLLDDVQLPDPAQIVNS